MRTLRRRWIDVLGLLFMLAVAGALMFALLPERTMPGQQVVPPLPASASNPTQAFLTIFVVMTTVGAPVTLAIVLALVMRWVSKQVSASSAAAETASRANQKRTAKSATDHSTAPLSPREERTWKIVATVLTLGITGGVVAALWPDLVRLFS